MKNDEQTRPAWLLDTLAKVDQAFSARLELQPAIELARRLALQGWDAEQAWVFLKNSLDGAETSWSCFPPDIPAVSQFLETDPALLSTLPGGMAYFSPAGFGQPVRLAAPLVWDGDFLGMIVVERSQAAFDTFDAGLLAHLASRLAAAIDAAHFQQAVQDIQQSKGKFVSVVTHELRIPMTSIKGYTDLLRSGVVGEVNEQQRSFLEVIRNNVERMSALVSDLSDISRAETGRLIINRNWCSVKDALDDAMLTLQNKFDAKSQTLDILLPPDLPRVYADASRVTQILSILLNNANKYTPAQGKIRITALAGEELAQKGLVRVDVVDNGIGISPEDQAKIYSQFFRSEDPLVREEPGWGLGLNVARLLTGLMGGESGFSSSLKQGSTFWFTLPTQADPGLS